jgi:hypothetical protein
MKENRKILLWILVAFAVICLLSIPRAKAQQPNTPQQLQPIVVNCPNLIGKGAAGWIPRLENTYICSVFDPNTSRYGIIVHNLDTGSMNFVMEDK